MNDPARGDSGASSKADAAKTDVTIATRDGRVLAATHFVPARPAGVSVLVNGATGVPRGYYGAFARHLASRGLTVLTYDYRGIGGSAGQAGTMEDWGRYDQTAAIDTLRELHPEQPLTIVGHSLGGQILGLADNVAQVRAAYFVSAQSGYWALWPWPGIVRMWLMWWVLIPVLARVCGRFPGERVGFAELPTAIALNWARWGRSPHYICDRRGKPLRPYNDRVAIPIRWLSFTDDDVAPLRAVEALRGYYPNSTQERAHYAPADLGAAQIGHFGFFRKTMPVAAWDAIADWLLERAGAAVPAR